MDQSAIISNQKKQQKTSKKQQKTSKKHQKNIKKTSKKQQKNIKKTTKKQQKGVFLFVFIFSPIISMDYHRRYIRLVQ